MLQVKTKKPSNHGAEADHELETDERLVRIARKRKYLRDSGAYDHFTYTQQVDSRAWENVLETSENISQKIKKLTDLEVDALTKQRVTSFMQTFESLADWQMINKPIVTEYLLLINEENGSIVQPETAAVINKCNRQSHCKILITNRILNRQVANFKWLKYLIVQIQSPDYTRLKVCLHLMEIWLPYFRNRIEYKSNRPKVSVRVKETTVDNTQLYYARQRFAKTGSAFGSLRCNAGNVTFSGSSSCSSSSTFKKNFGKISVSNSFCKGCDGAAIRDFILPFHPMGIKAGVAITSTTDPIHERELHHKRLSGDAGAAGSAADASVRYQGVLDGIRFCQDMHHGLHYAQSHSAQSASSYRSSDSSSHSPAVAKSSKLCCIKHSDLAHLTRLQLHYNLWHRSQLIADSHRDLLINPFPVMLRTFTHLHCRSDHASEESQEKRLETARQSLEQQPLRLMNPDTCYAEYCTDRQHLCRNPVIPYPNSLNPGTEIAEITAKSFIYFDIEHAEHMTDKSRDYKVRLNNLVASYRF